MVEFSFSQLIQGHQGLSFGVAGHRVFLFFEDFLKGPVVFGLVKRHEVVHGDAFGRRRLVVGRAHEGPGVAPFAPFKK